jgi:hypothetical protein
VLPLLLFNCVRPLTESAMEPVLWGPIIAVVVILLGVRPIWAESE